MRFCRISVSWRTFYHIISVQAISFIKMFLVINKMPSNRNSQKFLNLLKYFWSFTCTTFWYQWHLKTLLLWFVNENVIPLSVCSWVTGGIAKPTPPAVFTLANIWGDAVSTKARLHTCRDTTDDGNGRNTLYHAIIAF